MASNEASRGPAAGSSLSKKITLITGGVKSGKSRFALDLARRYRAGDKVFVATARVLDDDMRGRIAQHRQERGGDFVTVEEPLYLAAALDRIQDQAAVVLVDCCTMWVNNLLCRFSDDAALVREQCDLFLEFLKNPKKNIVLITNEVGLGIIPDNLLARRFARELGALNAQAAALSDEVIMMIAGLPQWVKGVDTYEPMDRKIEKYSSA